MDTAAPTATAAAAAVSESDLSDDKLLELRPLVLWVWRSGDRSSSAAAWLVSRETEADRVGGSSMLPRESSHRPPSDADDASPEKSPVAAAALVVSEALLA